MVGEEREKKKKEKLLAFFHQVPKRGRKGSRWGGPPAGITEKGKKEGGECV